MMMMMAVIEKEGMTVLNILMTGVMKTDMVMLVMTEIKKVMMKYVFRMMMDMMTIILVEILTPPAGPELSGDPGAGAGAVRRLQPGGDRTGAGYPLMLSSVR